MAVPGSFPCHTPTWNSCPSVTVSMCYSNSGFLREEGFSSGSTRRFASVVWWLATMRISVPVQTTALQAVAYQSLRVAFSSKRNNIDAPILNLVNLVTLLAAVRERQVIWHRHVGCLGQGQRGQAARAKSTARETGILGPFLFFHRAVPPFTPGGGDLVVQVGGQQGWQKKVENLPFLDHLLQHTLAQRFFYRRRQPVLAQ